MVVVPSAQNLTVKIFIKLGLLVIVAVFVMALAMSPSLCERDAAAGKKYRCCDGSNPFSNFHENSYVTRRMARRSTMALKPIMASRAFAASAVPVVVSVGAFVVAARVYGPIAEVAAVVCAESLVACDHRRRAVAVFVVPADVSVQCAASPGLVAGGADRAAAVVSGPAPDWGGRRSAVSTKEGGPGWSARYSPADSPDDSFPSGFREGESECQVCQWARRHDRPIDQAAEWPRHLDDPDSLKPAESGGNWRFADAAFARRSLGYDVGDLLPFPETSGWRWFRLARR